MGSAPSRSSLTGTVLVIVLVTKFVHGAWIAVVAMVFLWFLMRGIRSHYDRVSKELVADESDDMALPSRVHAIILVSKIHKPTLRAIAYARAARPTTIEALTVNVDPGEAERLTAEWERRHIPVPLKVLDSPYREVTRPVISYVKEIRRSSPRDLVTVYIPEYVVGHWWEQLPAQPVRAPAQGSPPLHTRGHGHERSVAADVVAGLAGRHAAAQAVDPRGATRMSDGPGAAGDELVLDVGAVAHGGHCVARHEGRVVFVRHTLPGERVRAVVTGTSAKFLRADAIEVLEAAPGRVPRRARTPDRAGAVAATGSTPTWPPNARSRRRSSPSSSSGSPASTSTWPWRTYRALATALAGALASASLSSRCPAGSGSVATGPTRSSSWTPAPSRTPPSSPPASSRRPGRAQPR